MEVSVWVAVAAGVPGLIALIGCALLWGSLRRARAAQRVLLPDGASAGLVDRQAALQRAQARLEEGLHDLEALVERQGEVTEASLRTSLRFQGMVRYDAYRDMGGQQSWSIALLDANQSGAVVTSLHARDHARVYLKEMAEGTPSQRLSPEEERAVAHRARPPGAAAARARGRSRARARARRPTRRRMTVGYLGPPGTFAEEALIALGPAGEAVPFPTVVDCFRAVREGDGARGPGPDRELDRGLGQPDARPARGRRRRAADPRRGGAPGAPPPDRPRRPSRPGELARVLSHPHATAQCQAYLRANCPGAEIVAAILADAGQVALDVAGVVRHAIERRIEQADEPRLLAHETPLDGGHSLAGELGVAGAGERPGLHQRVDLALVAGGGAERRAVVEKRAAKPLAVPAGSVERGPQARLVLAIVRRRGGARRGAMHTGIIRSSTW